MLCGRNVALLPCMNFEQLLDGATKGPWVPWMLNSASENPNRAAFIVGPKQVFMDKSAGFTAEDAEYIARCNPAVMREVWAALKEARDDASAFLKIATVFEDTEVRVSYEKRLAIYNRAVALLDGQTEKGGAE